MATPVGGLRIRLIRDNIFNMVHDGLEELGWLDEREHLPVSVRTKQIPHDEAANPNIVVVSVEDVFDSEAEMGSNLAEHSWLFFVDVYAEDEIVGLALGTDIRDILQGRFPVSVSRIGPNVDILDLQQATPDSLFHVDLENIDMERSRFAERDYQAFWWVVSFTVLDEYATEEDT